MTPDCFADCDIPYVPKLLDEFDIHWIIQLPILSRYSENDFSQISDKYDNLTTEFIISRTRERYPSKIFEYYKVIKIIKREKPDLVYVNLVANSPWQIPMLLALPKENTIVTAHQGRVHEGMGHYRYNYFMRDIVYRRIKNVNMFSESQAAYFKERYHDSVIYQIPLGLKYFGEPTNERPSDGDFRFLSFGIINYTKSIETLIDAACILYERGVRGFKVSINGSCKDWSWYQQRIKYPEVFELDIRTIDNNEIPNLFNGCHYLVQPYRTVSQSGPTKVAFCYNLPIICSDLPGFTDEIKEGICGYSFKTGDVNALADRMEYVIGHRNEYTQLLDNEKEYVDNNYSKTSIVKKYKDMFYSIIR